MCATPSPTRSPFMVVKALLLAAALALGACASLPDNVQRTPSQAFNSPESTLLGKLVQASTPANAQGSGFRLLGRADAAYTNRIALVDSAERSLDLQYYAIKQDESTDALFERLKAAAARGVRVRILLDDLSATGRDAHVLRLIAEKNIEIRLFNPLPGARSSLAGRILGSLGNASQAQQRMHNKVFIADNALAITGGRNIGDAYFGQGTDSNFVDLDVLAGGPIVREISASFDNYWNNKLAYPAESLLTPDEMKKLLGPVPEAPAKVASAATTADAATTANGADPSTAGKPGTQRGDGSPQTAGQAGPGDKADKPKQPLPDGPSTISQGVRNGKVDFTWAPALLLADKPGKLDPDRDAPPEETQDTLVDGLLAMMDRARGDLLIVSPYFVPGERMMALFEKLVKRGVRVRVLTNSLASNDAPIAHVGYARYRKDLLKIGVDLYEMRSQAPVVRGALGSGLGSSVPGSLGDSRASLHSKVIIMDGRLLVVGSMNLDLRSQLQNSEVALLIRSTRLADIATRMIEPTLQTDAWHMALQPDGQLLWRAPAGGQFKDQHSEPDASKGLQFLLQLVAPFAPDEML